MGLGNHELALNPEGSSSKELASYLTKLAEQVGADFNNRFYIVNTDLDWTPGNSMSKLYGGTIHRSVTIHGVTFLAVLGSDVVQEDMKYGKAQLYDRSLYHQSEKQRSYASDLNINRNMENHVYQEISKTHPSACVLLAHSTYNNIRNCLYYLHQGGLPKDNCLFTGHSHAKETINVDPKDKNIQYDLRAQIQPNPFGRGAAVVYATPGGKFVSDSEKTFSI